MFFPITTIRLFPNPTVENQTRNAAEGEKLHHRHFLHDAGVQTIADDAVAAQLKVSTGSSIALNTSYMRAGGTGGQVFDSHEANSVIAAFEGVNPVDSLPVIANLHSRDRS